MTWNGPLKSTFIELPDDLHGEMKAQAARRGCKVGEIYTAAAQYFLTSQIAGIPAKKVRRSGPDLPESVSDIATDVLDVIRTHQHDIECMECVLDIGRIWDVGDKEVQDAITQNCRVFARASESMQGSQNASIAMPQSDLQGRVGGLLDHEKGLDEALNAPPQAGHHTGAGGTRVQPVARKTTHPRKGRR